MVRLGLEIYYRDMYKGYIVGICIGDMLWTYVVEIRWLHWIPQVYVSYIGRGCMPYRRDMLRRYVGDMRWSHRIPQVYVGRICSGCTAVRVMSVGVVYLGWCQEHKSVPMTDIRLSLSYLVVMYVYIIAHFTTQFQLA